MPSVINSQLYICFISSLHALSLLLYHSLIFTAGSMPVFADPAVVCVLQHVSLNLNYREYFKAAASMWGSALSVHTWKSYPEGDICNFSHVNIALTCGL